eukprot:c11388_g1_i1.p1 GENE.c11388_g1_i1~~c11388_g1_i1.p1  ORF type:complete len:381 (-),score=149.64 c11388_g1_i1:68-1210(-)
MMKSNGNFMICEGTTLDGSCSPIWQTSTSGSGATLQLSSTGTLKVMSGSTVLWTSSSQYVVDTTSPQISSTTITTSSPYSTVITNGDSLTILFVFNENVLIESANIMIGEVSGKIIVLDSDDLKTVRVYFDDIKKSYPGINSLQYVNGIDIRYVIVSLTDYSHNQIQNLPLNITTGYKYYPNQISLGKVTAQSLSSGDGYGISFLAVDGDRTFTSAGYSCVNVPSSTLPWIRIDLSESCTVLSVIVTGYESQGGAYNIEIRVGNDISTAFGTTQPLCNSATIPDGGQTVTVNCLNPRQGRYVIVSIQGVSALHLCEVDVFGQCGCENDCSGHGTCSLTSHECTCDTGYRGDDCSLYSLSLGLSGQSQLNIHGESQVKFGG